MTGETKRPARSPGSMLGEAVTLRDWSPRTAHTQCLAHAWVPRWHAGGAEAVVADARDQAWECVLVESTSNGPLPQTALAKVLAAGATVLGPDRDEIRAALAGMDERLRRRLNRRRSERPWSDQRPILLLIGDGDHIPDDVLQRIAVLGRAAQVHLAVDERARTRTPRHFDENILGVYRGSNRPGGAPHGRGCHDSAGTSSEGSSVE